MCFRVVQKPSQKAAVFVCTKVNADPLCLENVKSTRSRGRVRVIPPCCTREVHTTRADLSWTFIPTQADLFISIKAELASEGYVSTRKLPCPRESYPPRKNSLSLKKATIPKSYHPKKTTFPTKITFSKSYLPQKATFTKCILSLKKIPSPKSCLPHKATFLPLPSPPKKKRCVSPHTASLHGG